MRFEDLNELFKVQGLLYVSLSFSLKKIFFCPHNVNKDFV